MFKSYLTLVLVLIFTACAGSKTNVTTIKNKVETITEITEKKLDTTIFIPGDTAELFIPFSEIIDDKGNVKPEALQKQFQKNKGRANVNAKIDSTGIKISSKCDSIAERLQFYEKKFKEHKQQTTDTQKKESEKKGFTLLELSLYMLATAVVSFAAAYLLKTFKII